jgi:hypothetical protein
MLVCTAVPMQRLRDRRKTTAVSRQQIGKHVPAATNTHATMESLMETVFSTRSCKGVIRKKIGATQSIVRLRVEFCKGGSEEMALQFSCGIFAGQ